MGFERASTEELAARAETSKRTLYAHFENKENLCLAVIELTIDLFLSKLKATGDYSHSPAEALVLFCGRFLEILLFARTIRMCRLSMAEAARFPQASARYFDVIFSTTHKRSSAYLKENFALSTRVSSEAAQELIGRVTHPRFPRALFGIVPSNQPAGLRSHAAPSCQAWVPLVHKRSIFE